MIRNCNDGSQSSPRLRCDVNACCVFDALPEFSTVPRGSLDEIYAAIKAAGFEGLQGGDPAVCRKVGLKYTADGRVNKTGEAASLVAKAKDNGADCATLHVAWGMETDAVVDSLVDDILNTSAKFDFPLYIETHRATITQDQFRTVELTNRHPDIRFNGDFSHWYTGQEMPYGGFDAKLAFIQPVLDRVRFIHGRICDGGAIQVDIGDGTNRPYVEHFKQLWTASFVGFLKSAKPGDYICFTPELLGPRAYYARTFKNAQGEQVEEGDRWEQAILYARIARDCFADAIKQLGL
jgi:hypothetical protein